MYCRFCGKVGFYALNCAYCGQETTRQTFAGQAVTGGDCAPFRLTNIAEPLKPVNLLYRIALILSCLIVTALFGIIFGIAGLKKSEKLQDSGEIMSILAIQVGGIVLLAGAFIGVFLAIIGGMFST